MTAGNAGFDGRGFDVEALCAAAREHAAALEAPGRVDWGAVRRGVRRRRIVRSTAAVASVVAVVAAGVAATYLLHRPAPPDGRGAAVASTAPAVEYRIVRPSDRVYVVAAADAAIVSVSAVHADLRSGTVWVRVDPGAGGAPFAVVTPDASVSVRGTRFAVSAEAVRGTTVAVLDGAVHVARRGLPGVVVAGGMQLAPGATVPASIDPAWRASLAALLPGTFHAAGGTARSDSPGEAAKDDDGALGIAAADELWNEAEKALLERRYEAAAELFGRAAGAEPRAERGGRAMMEAANAALLAGRRDLAKAAFERYLAAHPGGQMSGDARRMLCRLRGDTAGDPSCETSHGPGPAERRPVPPADRAP